jgi:CRISPR/Cas system-associated exonuclease Cas4 (RecB family)
MGYPIKFSHLKSLIDIIFDFQFNFQKFNSARLYHKPMLNFLDHPFVRGMIQDDTKITFFEEEIIKRNKIFIEWDELNELIPNIQNLKLLFQIWENPLKDGFKAFNSLTEALYTTFKSAEDKQIDLEIIYHFAKGFKKFELISSAYPYILNLKSFKRLFHQFWQGESLSFLGNPVDGIQVMGILETRTLDFENLIVLGMNEGNLPKTNIINSFIPRDLKLTHGLPVEEDRQAIFAHHFYRLLHRAKNIYFTFNSTTDGVGASEKSRFITQLENELDWSKGHKMEHFTYTSTDLSSDTKDIRYPSSEAVHKRLDEKLAQGLSPSAVNKLINCPLDFYYRYILGMKESAVVEENIEASTFGTKIHDVLETIFKINFLEKNKKLDIATLAQERKKIKAYLTAAYLEDFSPTDIKFGQNKLSFDVSLRFIDDFILAQIKEIKSTDSPIYIKHLEKTISATYNWEINGEMKTIKIEGNADRIDQFGSTYRIIDYKSGKCDESKVTLDEKILQEGVMEKFMQSSTKGYGRQLLMYALMFRAEFPEITEFSVGIISMINLTDWIQNVKTKKADTPLISSEVLDCFEAELKVLITDLYASNYYFEHDPKSQYCENCQT